MATNEIKSRPYQAGWRDFYDSQHTNPYADQSTDHRQWYRGWKDAKKVWRATKENR